MAAYHVTALLCETHFDWPYLTGQLRGNQEVNYDRKEAAT